MFLRFSITSILAMFTLNAQSQSLPVVFGSTSNMFVVDLNDVQIWDNDAFYLDMDNDGLTDVHFSVGSIYSPSGGTSIRYIHLSSSDSTFFSANPNYPVTISSTYPVTESHQDSFTVAIKGNLSDTLDTSGYYIQSLGMMTHFNFQWSNPCGPPCYYNSYYINEWDVDTMYLSLKKTITNYNYYGWVKISGAGAGPALTIHEYAFNTTLIGLENENDKSIFIYPNPTNDLVIIKGNFDSQIEIQNSLGQVIKTWQIDPSQTSHSMDLSDISNGVYWFVLSSQGKHLVKKLIKQ
jgi:hypothetical protein